MNISLWYFLICRLSWGTVPDWVAAVGGLLAFGGLVWTLGRDLRNRRADARESAALATRAQAERVTFFLDSGRSAHDLEAPTQAPGDRRPADAAEFFYGQALEFDFGVLVVVNASEGCVYEVIAHVPDGPEEFGIRGIGVLAPGVTRIAMPMRSFPGEGSGSWRFVGDFANNRLVEWIQFQDQAGRARKRSARGGLEMLANPEPFPDHSP